MKTYPPVPDDCSMKPRPEPGVAAKSARSARLSHDDPGGVAREVRAGEWLNCWAIRTILDYRGPTASEVGLRGLPMANILIMVLTPIAISGGRPKLSKWREKRG